MVNLGMECYSCLDLSGERPISPGGKIYDGKYWQVVHAYPTKLLGWLVIVLKRHTSALHELTNQEYLELSQLQEIVIKTLHQELRSEKEYLACFAEGEHFKHIHIHVIPKKADLSPDLIGPKIFQLLKVKEENAVSKQKVLQLSDKLRSKLKFK